MSKRAFLFLLLALAACGPKLKSQVKVQLDSLPSDYEVKVFATDLPTCAYEEVGLIASDDLEKTLSEARKMGADGVIGTILAQEGQPDRTESGTCGTLNCVQYNTVAIRFTDPSCKD
jgi:hypothetical protein